MNTDWADDVELTNEQLLEEVSRGAEEALHKMKVAAQTNTVPVDPLESLSDDELLAEWQNEAAKIEAADRDARAFEVARQFVAECPRYVESEWNAQRVDTYVRAKYGDEHVPTVDELHEVFDSLADRGLLQVREVPRTPRKVLTDADLEALSLDELEQLAPAKRSIGRVVIGGCGEAASIDTGLHH